MTLDFERRILAAKTHFFHILAKSNFPAMWFGENMQQDNYNPKLSRSSYPDVSSGQVLSVTDLTRCLRAVIEAEDLFSDLWVRGEISNLTKHSSGHVYFCLKDDSSLIRCIIWQNNARSIKFDLADGMSVVIRGRVTIYEKQGQYQIVVSELNPDGIGALYLAYEQLKAKLQAEGLFDETYKKSIPAFPRRIAIITSPTAAALQDMITIARRRMPSINLLLVPTLMQGTGSEAAVVESLRTADTIPDVDVIVLGRGGGSIEDLWTFNFEAVARTIYSCKTPIISAIGHETDYTLADFAADLRAPTPSAAIELIIPDREELAGRIQGMIDTITSTMQSIIANKKSLMDLIFGSPCFKYPERMLQDRWQTLDLLKEQLQSAFNKLLSNCDARLREVSARLESLSPLAVLARGYAIVRRTDDVSVVKKTSDVMNGDIIDTLISDGRLISEVKQIKEGWE